MPAGGSAYRKIDHLGGKYKRAHHSQERQFPFFELMLRPPNDVSSGRGDGYVESGPNRSG